MFSIVYHHARSMASAKPKPQTGEAKADYRLLGARSKYVYFDTRDEKRGEIESLALTSIQSFFSEEAPSPENVSKLIKQIFLEKRTSADDDRIMRIQEAIKSNSHFDSSSCLSATGNKILAFLAALAYPECVPKAGKDTTKIKQKIRSFFSDATKGSIRFDNSALEKFILEYRDESSKFSRVKNEINQYRDIKAQRTVEQPLFSPTPTTFSSSFSSSSALLRTKTTAEADSNLNYQKTSSHYRLVQGCRTMSQFLFRIEDDFSKYSFPLPDKLLLEICTQTDEIFKLTFFDPNVQEKAQDILRVYFTPIMTCLKKQSEETRKSIVDAIIRYNEVDKLPAAKEKEREIRIFFDSIQPDDSVTFDSAGTTLWKKLEGLEKDYHEQLKQLFRTQHSSSSAV